MIVPNNVVSDDSDDDLDNAVVDPYRRKYQLISERCEVLQQDNERLVFRINEVRHMLRTAKDKRKLILSQLDRHNDGWRNVPITLPMEDEPIAQAKVKVEKTTPVKGSAATKVSVGDKPGRKGSSTAVGQKRKRGEKAERDPNAPKRPANPFFQFCQEQRSLVMDHMSQDQEPSKQEVTKQLASKWNALGAEEKKIYYTKYEQSRDKYAAAMVDYRRDNPTAADKQTSGAVATSS